MDTHLRAIVKAVSYRFFGSLVTFAIVFAMAREIRLAVGVGLLDTICKIMAFYIHERVWDKINFGVKRKPDYNI